jgi:TatD DNase family protein
MLTDTHCHLDLDKFEGDRDAVIQRATEAGVERMLVPGLDLESSYAAVRLAELHKNIFAAVGYHPTDVAKITPTSYESLHELAEHPKVRAIGEIGLDYYWMKETGGRLLQRYHLNPQLNLATDVNKPVIIHLREENDAESGEATEDIFDMLRTWRERLQILNHPLYFQPGVFHSFNGNLESAQRAIEMNFFIGITGSVTHKKNDAQRDMIKHIPLNQLLIETDSPFQTPIPHRGKRNEPANVRYVADKIAEVHQTTREIVANITTTNANRLFGWEAVS